MAKTKVCAFRLKVEDQARVDKALLSLNKSDAGYVAADFYHAAVLAMLDDFERGGKTGKRVVQDWLEIVRQ